MKLQYLGDSRDAFKWDLLHWICTGTSFWKLVYVPMLTPKTDRKNDGQIPHHRFKCQEFVRPFLESLKQEPRSLDRIISLAVLDPKRRFQASIFAPNRHLESGPRRSQYWSGFDASTMENSVVFFDPDNGFVPRLRHERGKSLRPEWIGHNELKRIMDRMPETSAVVVYQHRPRRTWIDVFDDLSRNLDYVHTAVVAHESTLAFVALAGNAIAGKEIAAALKNYACRHADVDFTSLRPVRSRTRLGPEMAFGPDGKEDAALHDYILNNPEADKAFRDSIIRKSVSEGMSLEMAYRLYGDKKP